MPFICPDCENTTRFQRVVSGRCWYTETQYVDEAGDWEDTQDLEHEDYESTDYEPVTCVDCGSTADDVSTDEWASWTGPRDEDEDIKGSSETWEEYIERKK